MSSKILAILTVFLLFTITVSAQEDIDATDEGIAPDSPLYFLDTALDRINLALTFSKESRAKLEVRLSEERLREVNLMIQKNKLEVAKKVQIAHSNRLLKARERIKDLDTTTDEDTIAELETELEDQELLVEDAETASLTLPEFKAEDRIKREEIIKELRKSSEETKLRIRERREELIKLRPELEEKLRTTKEVKLKENLNLRIEHITDKVERSKQILERRSESSDNENLDLAIIKLEEAKQELESSNFEEAKALTLEANKLAVLVRGKSEEARKKLLDIKEIAKTREKIKFRKDILERDRERLKNAIEVLRERESKLRERSGTAADSLLRTRDRLEIKEDEIRERSETEVRDGNTRIRTKTETRIRDDGTIEEKTKTEVKEGSDDDSSSGSDNSGSDEDKE
tara:strand:- start:4343 stop:5548 length:1206 start_codon:yes stop_codon:yes gene_type:complete